MYSWQEAWNSLVVAAFSLLCYQAWRRLICHIQYLFQRLGNPWIFSLFWHGHWIIVYRAKYFYVSLIDYLISMSVTTNNNWFHPSWYESGNVPTDYCLSEHSSTKNVADRTIGRFPHCLQIKLWQCDIKQLSNEWYFKTFFKWDCKALNRVVQKPVKLRVDSCLLKVFQVAFAKKCQARKLAEMEKKGWPGVISPACDTIDSLVTRTKACKTTFLISLANASRDVPWCTVIHPTRMSYA